MTAQVESVHLYPIKATGQVSVASAAVELAGLRHDRRWAIVDHGRIVVTGAPEQLKDGLHGDAVIVELASAEHAARGLHLLQRLPGLDEVLVDGRVLRSRAASGAGALPQVLAALEDADLAVSSATVARPSLDDVYLRHTGHSYSEGATA